MVRCIDFLFYYIAHTYTHGNFRGARELCRVRFQLLTKEEVTSGSRYRGMNGANVQSRQEIEAGERKKSRGVDSHRA